ERVRSREDDVVPVLAQAVRELADRRRLAGAVDADHEDDARSFPDRERPRLAEERRGLLCKRLVQVAELRPRLEPPDELRGGAHADVRGDQRLLEPLPRLLVLRVERGGGELLRQRSAALSERVAQAREEAGPSLLGLRRRALLA